MRPRPAREIGGTMLTGKNLIAGEPSDSADGRFTARGALAEFDEASGTHVDDALADARAGVTRLSAVAGGCACGIPRSNRRGDRTRRWSPRARPAPRRPCRRNAWRRAGRTVSQLRMFANLVRDGSWVDARIDRALPDRKPLPKPDIRRMLDSDRPGRGLRREQLPAGVLGRGGDTASALAAGCPVVVKAHPAHPATSELVARAIVGAVKASGMPAGVFSLLHSTRHDVAIALVRHPSRRPSALPEACARARALFDAAAARPDPIPVYAEMGSVNPVFCCRERSPNAQTPSPKD